MADPRPVHWGPNGLDPAKVSCSCRECSSSVGTARTGASLTPCSSGGSCRTCGALVDRGGRGVLKAPLPNHSWSAWPSFLTGVDPADHGVYDILESRGGSGRQFPVTFRSIRERDHPRRPVAGRGPQPVGERPPHVPAAGGFGGRGGGGRAAQVAPVHPPRVAGQGPRGGRHPVPDQRDVVDDVPQPARPVPRRGGDHVRRRQRATERLLDTADWRVASRVQVATDRIQHCLAKYCLARRTRLTPTLSRTRSPTACGRLPAARRGAGRPGAPDRAGRPGGVHERPRVPVLHGRREHGPAARASSASWSSRRRRRSSGRCNGGRSGRWRERSTTCSACTARSPCPSP